MRLKLTGLRTMTLDYIITFKQLIPVLNTEARSGLWWCVKTHQPTRHSHCYRLWVFSCIIYVMHFMVFFFFSIFLFFSFSFPHMDIQDKIENYELADHFNCSAKVQLVLYNHVSPHSNVISLKNYNPLIKENKYNICSWYCWCCCCFFFFSN